MGSHKDDFYVGMPAVTCNRYGKGKAYYIAFRDTGDFTVDFYEEIILNLQLEKSLNIKLPNGVTAHTRQDEAHNYVFIRSMLCQLIIE